MAQIIDRRNNSKHKSAVNRSRFIRRHKQQIKKAVSNAIHGRSIKDIESGEKVSIPAKDTHEPHFHHGQGGKREIIHPGNVDFSRGDKVKRPQSGQGGGSGGGDASNKGEGEDSFTFELSREEFLNLFFEDLELPNLIKRKLNKIDSYKYVRAGHTPTGIPANINVVRSLTRALGRRRALAGPYREQLEQEEKALAKAKKNQDQASIDKIKKNIAHLKEKIERIPFIDTFDLRFNNRIKQPTPSTQAVMFCLMDVSGSMDEAKKDIAKRFFILLYMFLTRAYKKIDVVFIRHHTSAKEVNEHDFFYSRETGGTVVSSALEMMAHIIKERYNPNDWNIYGAQASDGDNWMNDSPQCKQILINDIMPVVQYFAYIEIMPRQHQSLWEVYTEVKSQFEHFAMQHIENQTQIYPVFRDLFKKEETA